MHELDYFDASPASKLAKWKCMMEELWKISAICGEQCAYARFEHFSEPNVIVGVLTAGSWVKCFIISDRRVAGEKAAKRVRKGASFDDQYYDLAVGNVPRYMMQWEGRYGGGNAWTAWTAWSTAQTLIFQASSDCWPWCKLSKAQAPALSQHRYIYKTPGERF